MDEIQFTRDLLVNNKEIVHTGRFKIDDLYLTINRALESRSYIKREKRSEELVASSGRQVYVELRPYKYVSSEIKLMIKIKINLEQVTETKFEGEHYHQGDLRISFDAWYMTNYRKKWTLRPWWYFLKGVIGKYLYQWPEEKNSRELLVSDTAVIYAAVRKLLQNYQPKAQKYLSETEVIKEAGKEMKKGNGLISH